MISDPVRYSRYRNAAIVPDAGIPSYGEWNPPSIRSDGERLYVVTDADLLRPDLIAWRVYRVPHLWWVIALHNGIADPFTLRTGDKLRIPSAAAVESALTRAASEALATSAQAAQVVPDEAFRALSKPVFAVSYVAPPYRSPYLVSEAASAFNESTTTAVQVFNYALPIPAGTGSAHFQVQVSEESDWTPVALSRMTAVSQTRWFYYDPLFNSGAGGFRPFPAGGLAIHGYEGQTLYYTVVESDGLQRGRQYFFRHRAIIDETEQEWIAAPPLTIP